MKFSLDERLIGGIHRGVADLVRQFDLGEGQHHVVRVSVKFIMYLQESYQMTEKEWEEQQHEAEIAAVEGTIKVLDADVAHDHPPSIK